MLGYILNLLQEIKIPASAAVPQAGDKSDHLILLILLKNFDLGFLNES
jgi:hypothetical protein